jgi:hypothetical protein
MRTGAAYHEWIQCWKSAISKQAREGDAAPCSTVVACRALSSLVRNSLATLRNVIAPIAAAAFRMENT